MRPTRETGKYLLRTLFLLQSVKGESDAWRKLALFSSVLLNALLYEWCGPNANNTRGQGQCARWVGQ